MTKRNKHILSLGLISSSILMLLVLQFFWLQKNYQEKTYLLRREADNLFRAVIGELQDSLLKQSIHPLRGEAESLFPLPMVGNKRVHAHHWHASRPDSGHSLRVEGSLPQADSLAQLPDSLRTAAQVRVILASTHPKDSLDKVLRVLAADMQRRTGFKNFLIRLNNDSLRVSSIRAKFQKGLDSLEIHLPFRVQYASLAPGPKDQGFVELDQPEQGFIVPRFIPPSPIGGHFALFPNHRSYVLGKMLPEILFSVFLTLVTVSAFYVGYHTLRQQQRLTDLKNDFISNVTHELKTPVTTVGVALEALSNFNGLANPELTREYLAISKQELQRLGLLVDKIMKTAVFEQKGIALQVEAIDFQELADRVLASMKLQFERVGAEVQFCASGDNFRLEGDQVHLTNVFYNLLENALKYSEKDPKITISLEALPDQIALSVTDNGIGVPPEYRTKIFEKFFRVPTGDVHNTKGYGLGLSYVAGVVRQHGGSIDVDSEVGKGSCFKVHLPRYQKHPPHAPKLAVAGLTRL
jgi:signal transduction histidine kinase